MKLLDASQFAGCQYHLHCKYFFTWVEASSNIKVAHDFVSRERIFELVTGLHSHSLSSMAF
jgi:hypothetical protein